MTVNDQINKLVKKAKAARVNRVYYESCFSFTDIRSAGIVQSLERTALDRVQLDEDRNEHYHLFGVDKSGSFFDLKLSIVSLYPEGAGCSESSHRLATLNFVMGLRDEQSDKESENAEYSYETEQIIDYSEKRRHSSRHEHRNMYKLGSISIETVLPFSFSRILFNGLMKLRHKQQQPEQKLVPIRLSISTHPTCDKFDFRYLFDINYTTSIIEKSIGDDPTAPRKLLDQVLDDRIDQPLMFQGQLNELETGVERKFIMWGAKSKKFLQAKQELLAPGLPASQTGYERLFAWSESGQQIHLTRAEGSPNLVHGMVHNVFDYASHFYACSLLAGTDNKPSDFSCLESFGQFDTTHKLQIRAFRTKEYTLEFRDKCQAERPQTFAIKINGFNGWALVAREQLGAQILAAQAKLWQMQIVDRSMSFQFAHERLLGGKANSLVQLARVSSAELASISSTSLGGGATIRVSVPRGIVLTCLAYKWWARSEPRIQEAIGKLDRARRCLAASMGVHLNPLASEFVSLAEAQKRLREQCEQTKQALCSCALPAQLRQHLAAGLSSAFEHQELYGEPATACKKFAVRSSAVGEDALETSAAGQMITILGVQGFEAICSAVVECWASQFEFEATSYKSQNGLEFDLPMSVVVQELVECQVAGVAATCNPLNGNKMQLEMIANYGLGEGVVSGGRVDTVRLHLARAQLDWDAESEAHRGELHLSNCSEFVEKLPADPGKACCLSDAQIVALGNLLLRLRRNSGDIKDREIEWGITYSQSAGSSSSSSSSSSGSAQGNECSTFQVHLLQSRPLTHLQRLESREIEHELDCGISSPIDTISRANLGEVMPGALCALNQSYFQPVTTSLATLKPYEENHTRKIFVADTFAFYSNLATMVLSYSDSIKRFSDMQRSETQRALVRSSVRLLIGTEKDETDMDEAKQYETEIFHKERLNPNSRLIRRNLAKLFASDSGLYALTRKNYVYRYKNFNICHDLPSIDSLIARLQRSQTSEMKQFMTDIETQLGVVWHRLCTDTKALRQAWECHMLATVMNMSINTVCLKMMSEQPAYPDELDSKEILSDFSTMMRAPEQLHEIGKHTESGDISKLLTRLVDLIVSEGELERARLMKHKELYDYLSAHSTSADAPQASKLFQLFIKRNAHRAYKEFCLSTKTWGDDCSYIIRTLAMRLKTATISGEKEAAAKLMQTVAEHTERVALIESKLTRAKFVLTKYVFPRARNATVRREQSKSLLIGALHKYRLAFRHIGALLCLAGRLPAADLVFWLCAEELDQVINYKQLGSSESAHQDLPRLIYKARRRQKRARSMQSVKFPRPLMSFEEMARSIEQQLRAQTSGASSALAPETPTANNSHKVQVRGLTSCSGKVTGRACVVASIDDMEQLEPNDILVTYSIDISWSVYFFALGGIVTELGGIISHGAVVAREYGIPTLCTAIGACSLFKTGQIITLDSDNGVCYLADDSQQQPDANSSL